MDRFATIMAELEKFRGVFSDAELNEMFETIRAKYL